MRIRLILAFFAAASVLVIACLLPLAAQVSVDCSEPKLPDAATKLLKTQFPSWRPKQVSDLDEDNRGLWSKAHDRQCPGIAVGRFERADKSDYALLLVPNVNPGSGYKLILLGTSRTGDYTVRVVDHAEGPTYSGLVISTLPPGKYSDFGGRKSVRIKLDSIHLEWIEKGAQLFYWSASRYHKLQISD